MSMITAEYQCQYEVVDARGRITRMADTQSRTAPLDNAASRDEAGRAAWAMWRQLVPYHKVRSVSVTAVETRVDGRWKVQPLAYRFTYAELRDLSPAGSEFAS